MMGEYTLPADYKARLLIEVDPENKKITITDNGLGMTADEVEEYINQIAFSGANDFLEKYKISKTNLIKLELLNLFGRIRCLNTLSFIFLYFGGN